MSKEVTEECILKADLRAPDENFIIRNLLFDIRYSIIKKWGTRK